MIGTHNLTGFEQDTIRLFHGTDAEYDLVDSAILEEPGEKCSNCALGLWLTPDENMAARFGSRVLTFEMPTAGIELVPFEVLKALHSRSVRDEDGGFARHASFSADLRNRGKSLMIVVESDDTWGTAVAIDPSIASIVDSRPSDTISQSPRP